MLLQLSLQAKLKKKKKKKEKEKKLHGDEANGQYNAKWLLSLVYVSKPLITKVTAIEPSFRTDCFSFLSLSFFFFVEGNWTFFPIRIAHQRRENQL